VGVIKKITEEQKQEIIKLYTQEHRGQLYISKKVLGVNNPGKIKKVLKESNIPIRNFSEAATLSNKNREKHKNKKFFSKSNENPDMAWLMGFIAADGTIRKDSNEIKIGLARKDKEILEKIKITLELETTVKDYISTNGYDCSCLQWTCEKHKKDLARYSIVPAKTFILKPPYQLDKKYWIDYIRGYFDGDGSINLIQNSNGRGNGNLRWQVCSATKEIIEWIVDFLYDEYEIPKVKIQIWQREHPLYGCQYSSSATRKIYNILYTPNSLFLKRKKDHFEEILRQVKPLNE
jgi:hypothetical protein